MIGIQEWKAGPTNAYQFKNTFLIGVKIEENEINAQQLLAN